VLQQAPEGAVFSGKTAAWLHGLELEPCDPIEMIVPRRYRSRHRAAAQRVGRVILNGDEDGSLNP
jgi:hypothetical protein